MKKGTIEVICGCMFCGKTEEMIRRLRRAQIGRLKVQAFKPMLDTRSDDLASHSLLNFACAKIEHPREILALLEPDTRVVAIDEVQFFDDSILFFVEELIELGIRVILAGLDLDFRGVPFGFMPQLLARAEKVDKLEAVCVVCGDPATKTQRLIDGEPAAYDDPVVLIGAAEVYEARCHDCHEVAPPRGTLQ
jgi:thymidine kinase